MKILYYYIFGEQLKIFVISLFTILAVFLLEKVNFLSNLFLAQRTSVSTAGVLLLYLCPSFLTLATPLAVLMSSLMTFSRMSSDNEITAMRACGLSFATLLAPVIAFSIIVTGASLYLSVNVAHQGNLLFQQTAMKILGQSIQTEIKERRFYSEFPGLMIYVNTNHKGALSGIFVSDQRNSRQTNIIEARTGVIDSDKESGVIHLGLKNGILHSSGEGYRTIAFKEYLLKLDMGAKLNQPLQKEAPQMSIPELYEQIEENDRIGKPYFREQVEIHKKFSIPLGCLAMGVLGAMAGVWTHQRGSSGGFGLGVILMIINYLLIMIGQGLGAGGKIPPVLGVWGPDIIMTAATIILFLRVSRDTMPTKLETWASEKWMSFRLKVKPDHSKRL